MNVPEVMTPLEVAEYARLSKDAVYRAIRAGRLEASELVPGRYRINRDQFQAWWDAGLHRNPRRRQAAHPRKPTTRSRAGSVDRLTALEQQAS